MSANKGKAENPYVPKYIKDAPWYQEQTNSDDYLSHHRGDLSKQPNNEPKMGQGIKDEFVSSENITSRKLSKNQFKRLRNKKKGRCLNCGGDHDKKDCLEKPRLIKGDKDGVTGDGSIVQRRNEDVDYDGKRDRWYGYDVNDYTKYLKEWDNKEKLKKEEDERKKAEEGGGDGDRLYDTDEEIELMELGLMDDPEFKDAIKQDGEKIIRLREDKAVYLRDVRNDTITYDPKSRMIRDDSTGYFNEQNLFVKHMTGEALKYEKSKTFAWDDKARGIVNDNHVANPTLADRKIVQMSKEDQEKKDRVRNSILDRYGGSMSIKSGEEEEEEEEEEEDLDNENESQPRRQSGQSKYVEDQYYQNHTSVYGSYYHDGQWGYQCCHSIHKNSYCNK